MFTMWNSTQGGGYLTISEDGLYDFLVAWARKWGPRLLLALLGVILYVGTM